MRRLFLSLFLFVPYTSHAALTTISGESESIWTEAKMSVIVAIVKETRPLHGDYLAGTDRATLIPKATLAGAFDPSLHPELEVIFWTGSIGTSIPHPPDTGSTILAVIELPGKYLPRKQAIIVPSICSFMPRNIWNHRASSSIAIIKGLDDPQVAQTLKRIQQARLKGKASTPPAPDQRPGTKTEQVQLLSVAQRFSRCIEFVGSAVPCRTIFPSWPLSQSAGYCGPYKLKNFLQTTIASGQKISELRITAHGNPESVFIGNDEELKATPDGRIIAGGDSKESITQYMQDALATDAHVIIQACDTGRTPKDHGQEDGHDSLGDYLSVALPDRVITAQKTAVTRLWRNWIWSNSRDFKNGQVINP